MARRQRGHVDQRSEEIAARWKIWRHRKVAAAARPTIAATGSIRRAVFDALWRVSFRKTPSSRSTSATTPIPSAAISSAQRQAVLMSRLSRLDRLLVSRGHGRLGGHAGATIARFRGRKVVSISGDGGFGQYMAELTTAVKYRMDVTHVLLRNDELGKISKEQRSGEWDVWATDLVNPDFAAYAELCGALGIRVETKDALDDAWLGPSPTRDRAWWRSSPTPSSSSPAARGSLRSPCPSRCTGKTSGRVVNGMGDPPSGGSPPSLSPAAPGSSRSPCPRRCTGSPARSASPTAAAPWRRWCRGVRRWRRAGGRWRWSRRSR